MIQIFLYILAILTANVITAALVPMTLGILIIPAGTWLIGLTFGLRDWVQYSVGRKKSYLVICFALAASAVTSHLLGDTLYIVGASALSFLVSETMDTEIFTRYNTSLVKRVFASGTIASIFDSLIFAVAGLIPAGFITWAAIPYVVIGQISVKLLMQALAVIAMQSASNFRKDGNKLNAVRH
jgi:uncharacterized PurR-regulated membrane protein YhhQ (DUF165 family)